MIRSALRETITIRLMAIYIYIYALSCASNARLENMSIIGYGGWQRRYPARARALRRFELKHKTTRINVACVFILLTRQPVVSAIVSIRLNRVGTAPMTITAAKTTTTAAVSAAATLVLDHILRAC